MTDVLCVERLNFGFGNAEANVLRDIAFTVRAGEIISIIGKSGCGKSTLLNLIAGLEKPTNGTIAVRGAGGGTARRIGYIFQEDALLPWRTIGANLRLAVEVGGVDRKTFDENIDEYLSSFHLDKTILPKYPAQLSGGMKQRVAIIQTLLFNPSLLLLDEPFSALDFYTRLSLESEFYNFVKSKSKTALMVTHDIEEAIAVSDRVILLSPNGTIQMELPISFDVQSRDPEDVRALPEFSAYYASLWSQLKAGVSA